MSEAEVLRLLRAACKEWGAQKNWAESHDISPQSVCDVLKRRREPGASILSALGLERVVSYRRVQGDPNA